MKKLIDLAKANQKPLLAGLAIVAILILIWGVNQGTSTAPSSLKLASKEGEVLFSANGAIWEFADPGVLLADNASIKTSGKAKAILQTPQGDFVRLSENTEIKINSVTKSGLLLTQNSGRSFHRVKDASNTLYQISALGNTIKASGTFDLSVNPAGKRINAKVLEGQISLALANNLSDSPVTVDKGNEITADEQTQTVSGLANACLDYMKSDWFRWNKDEDLKLGYELRCEAGGASPTPTPEATNASPTAPKPSLAKTTTTTPAPKPTSTYTGGSCKPYLSLKRGLNGLGIQLSWSTCKNDDFQFYKVIRSTTNPNLTYPSNPALVTSSNRTFGSYWDKNLALGQTYYYRICVVERLNQVGCGNVAKMAN